MFLYDILSWLSDNFTLPLSHFFIIYAFNAIFVRWVILMAYADRAINI